MWWVEWGLEISFSFFFTLVKIVHLDMKTLFFKLKKTIRLRTVVKVISIHVL